jgi:hypothetical protein
MICIKNPASQEQQALDRGGGAAPIGKYCCRASPAERLPRGVLSHVETACGRSPELRFEIGESAVEGDELGIIDLGNVDAETVMNSDDEVE